MSRVSRTLTAIALSSAFAAIASSASAQGVINQPRLSAHLANQVVGDTVAICAQKKYNVWAVIVDLEGVRLAVLRGNGAPIHSQDNAYYKAYAAASLTLGRNEGSTHEIAAAHGEGGTVEHTEHAVAQCHLRRGGMAIRAGDGRIIGGLGVSGAPGGQLRRGLRQRRARQDQGSAEVDLGSSKDWAQSKDLGSTAQARNGKGTRFPGCPFQSEIQATLNQAALVFLAAISLPLLFFHGSLFFTRKPLGA